MAHFSAQVALSICNIQSKTFGNPAAYIEEFNKRVEIGNLTTDEKKDNVVKFLPKNEALEEDDYDY